MTTLTPLPIKPNTTIKSAFLSALTLCLTTLGLLTSNTATALTLTDVAQLQPTQETCNYSTQTTEIAKNISTTASLSATANVTPPLLSPSQQGLICDILLAIAYSLPIGVGLGIFLHHRYVNYRSAILQEQIQTLERIWQKSPQY